MGIESTWTDMYPDLFVGLTDRQQRDVVASIDNGVLEGWQPSRDDITILTAEARGLISRDDILREARGEISGEELIQLAAQAAPSRRT